MSETTLAAAELAALRGGLVVSCQARAGSPLRDSEIIAALAEAAVFGGAAGIRAEGADDVAAIRRRVPVPVIGIRKVVGADGGVFITPTAAAVLEVVAAGARLVALDGTSRDRPGGEALGDVVAAIHAAGALALADVATVEDGPYAVAGGVDAVGTTLSGYTPGSLAQEDPDLDLVRDLAATCPIPVFAEGRVWTPEQAAEAMARGAAFVVVGTAITDPTAITRRFARAVAEVANAGRGGGR